MVQISGKYTLDKNENYATYLKSLGAPEELAQKAESHQLAIDIIVEGNKYTFLNGDKTHLSFTLDEEFDEPIVAVGVTLKTLAKMEGNKLIITSNSPDGRSGVRTYEFTDSGYVLTMKAGDVSCKRYYSRA